MPPGKNILLIRIYLLLESEKIAIHKKSDTVRTQKTQPKKQQDKKENKETPVDLKSTGKRIRTVSAHFFFLGLSPAINIIPSSDCAQTGKSGHCSLSQIKIRNIRQPMQKNEKAKNPNSKHCNISRRAS